MRSAISSRAKSSATTTSSPGKAPTIRRAGAVRLSLRREEMPRHDARQRAARQEAQEESQEGSARKRPAAVRPLGSQPCHAVSSIVVAVAENGVDRQRQSVAVAPARRPEALQGADPGQTHLMGRKTYDSIGRPLPGRTNIVVRGSRARRSPGCVVSTSSMRRVAGRGRGGESCSSAARDLSHRCCLARTYSSDACACDIAGMCCFRAAIRVNGASVVTELIRPTNATPTRSPSSRSRESAAPCDWNDHARFNCSKCPGYCCSHSRIAVSDYDIARLAKHFDLSVEEAKRTLHVSLSDQGSRRADPAAPADHIYKIGLPLLRYRRASLHGLRGAPNVCRKYPYGNRCGYYEFLKFEREHQDDDEISFRRRECRVAMQIACA